LFTKLLHQPDLFTQYIISGTPNYLLNSLQKVDLIFHRHSLAFCVICIMGNHSSSIAHLDSRLKSTNAPSATNPLEPAFRSFKTLSCSISQRFREGLRPAANGNITFKASPHSELPEEANPQTPLDDNLAFEQSPLKQLPLEVCPHSFYCRQEPIESRG